MRPGCLKTTGKEYSDYIYLGRRDKGSQKGNKMYRSRIKKLGR